MTPIFSRIWFVKMQVVRAFEMSEVSLRNAALLRLRYHGEGERCFPGRFRSENFNHATTRKSAYAQSAIDQNVASRNYINVDDLFGAQAHDRAFTVILRYLLDSEVEVLVSRGS